MKCSVRFNCDLASLLVILYAAIVMARRHVGGIRLVQRSRGIRNSESKIFQGGHGG